MISKILKKFEVNNQEIRFIFYCLSALIIVSSIWLIYGWLNTPPGSYFLGINLISPGDTYVYLSEIEQARQGKWLQDDLYTSEPQAPFLPSPLWLAIGFTAKIFKISNLLAYQLSRLILMTIFLFVLYLFISYFFSEKIKRKFIFVFLVTSSGWGLIWAPLLMPYYFVSPTYINWPMDLWAAEAITFLTLYQSPLKILSLILIILIFLFFLISTETKKIKYSYWSGASGLALIYIHPFEAPIIYAVLLLFSIYLFVVKKFGSVYKYYLSFAAVALPPIFYYWYLINFNSFFLNKNLQNFCLTPSLPMTLAGYGLLLPLALLALLYYFKGKEWSDSKTSFLVIWLATQLILIYSPLTFQRRLVQGLHIVIAILAASALFKFYPRAIQKLGQNKALVFRNYFIAFIFLYLILFSLSNLYVIAADILLSNQREGIMYLDRDKKFALNWLNNNSKPPEVILSHQATGNLIPGLIGRKVFVGHWVETLFYEKKKEQVKWFFGNNLDDNKKSYFLRQNQIDYIFYSDKERSLGDFKPEKKDFLELIYRNKSVEIYKTDY